jgi:hypothetical protein
MDVDGVLDELVPGDPTFFVVRKKTQIPFGNATREAFGRGLFVLQCATDWRGPGPGVMVRRAILLTEWRASLTEAELGKLSSRSSSSSTMLLPSCSGLEYLPRAPLLKSMLVRGASGSVQETPSYCCL